MAAPAPESALAAEPIDHAPSDVLRARGPRRFRPDAQRRRRLFQLLRVQFFVKFPLVLRLRRPRACGRVPERLTERYEEAKSLLRKMMPVARQVLGDAVEVTLQMRKVYAAALCNDPGGSLDDVREAVTTLEESERTARRVFGATHPTEMSILQGLKESREALRAREGTA